MKSITLILFLMVAIIGLNFVSAKAHHPEKRDDTKHTYEVSEHTDFKDHKSKYPKKIHKSYAKKHVGVTNNHEDLNKHHESKDEHGTLSHHTNEKALKGQKTKVHHKKEKNEEKGKKTSHVEKVDLSHHQQSTEKSVHENKHEDSKKASKHNVLKAFQEKYHKKEHRKRDSFYSTKDKKGEYHHFGEDNSKHHGYHHDKTETGKYRAGKYTDKYGKEGKTHKEHNIKKMKTEAGGHNGESHFVKTNKWMKKNHS